MRALAVIVVLGGCSPHPQPPIPDRATHACDHNLPSVECALAFCR